MSQKYSKITRLVLQKHPLSRLVLHFFLGNHWNFMCPMIWKTSSIFFPTRDFSCVPTTPPWTAASMVTEVSQFLKNWIRMQPILSVWGVFLENTVKTNSKSQKQFNIGRVPNFEKKHFRDFPAVCSREVIILFCPRVGVQQSPICLLSFRGVDQKGQPSQGKKDPPGAPWVWRRVDNYINGEKTAIVWTSENIKLTEGTSLSHPTR